MQSMFHWCWSLLQRFLPSAPGRAPETVYTPEPVITPEPIAVVTPPVPDPEPPAENGLRHSWKQASAAWLYPGDPKYWIASHRLMTWPQEKIAMYLEHQDLAGTTHVIICANTANRPETFETPFNALQNQANSHHARAVFEQVIAADFAPILWCCSQEFFIQQLGRHHGRLLDHLMETCVLLRDLCQIAVPFRELGDIYGGSAMSKRNDIFKAMRTGAPTLPLAEHERPMVEIPVDDFRGVDGDVISLLQGGFRTPVGGKNRPEDRVQKGDHTYDGVYGLVQKNLERMSEWQRKGRMERHTNAIGEHSLPQVYPGQPWGPTRTIRQARSRGHILLEAGAQFDLSSGAQR
jgi:hypothetical protein